MNQKEVFMGYHDCFSLTKSESLNAKTMCEIVCKIIENLKLDTSKLVSVCTDGANLLSGKESGCIKRLKEKFPNLLYTICFAHSLNLCINSALNAPILINSAKTIEKLHSFFSISEKSYSFLNCSGRNGYEISTTIRSKSYKTNTKT